MNANQIINMVIRQVMRRVIGSGVNAGINAVGKRMSKDSNVPSPNTGETQKPTH